jgi:hypothetical protein
MRRRSRPARLRTWTPADADGARSNDFATRPAVIADRTIVARIFRRSFAHQRLEPRTSRAARRGTDKQAAFRALAPRTCGPATRSTPREALSALAAGGNVARARNPRGRAAGALANNVEQVRSSPRPRHRIPAGDRAFRRAPDRTRACRRRRPQSARAAQGRGGLAGILAARRGGDAWRKFAFLTVGARSTGPPGAPNPLRLPAESDAGASTSSPTPPHC